MNTIRHLESFCHQTMPVDIPPTYSVYIHSLLGRASFCLYDFCPLNSKRRSRTDPAPISSGWVFIVKKIDKLQYFVIRFKSVYNSTHLSVIIFQLRNSDFKMYGEFCGKTLPRSFSFYHGKALMMFSSDKTKTEAGFSLAYEGTFLGAKWLLYNVCLLGHMLFFLNSTQGYQIFP